MSNTSLDFISDMGVTGHRRYDRWYKTQNRESSATRMLFKKIDPFRSQLFR